MKDWLDDFRLAVGMLTRIPVPHPDGPAPPYLARAHRVFPVVGAAIGAIVGVVYMALLLIGAPALAAAALALGAGMLVTGAFHEDGIADVTDGFGGGRDKAAKLEILRDSRIGTYGTLGLLVSFTVKLASLTTLSKWPALAALIVAHALSRALLPAVTRALPYARADGLGASAGKCDGPTVAIAAVIGLIIALFCLPIVNVLLSAVVAVVAVVAIAVLARRQIGGYTGDVLGAAQQCAETAILLLLAIRSD